MGILGDLHMNRCFLTYVASRARESGARQKEQPGQSACRDFIVADSDQGKNCPEGSILSPPPWPMGSGIRQGWGEGTVLRLQENGETPPRTRLRSVWPYNNIPPEEGDLPLPGGQRNWQVEIRDRLGE